MTDIDTSAIAIVGLSARVSGAKDIRQFWHNLREGVESIRDLSAEELLAAGVAPELAANPHYVKRAAVFDDLAGFDAEFFGFSPKEAAIMDPQHRHFLETAWEAIEDAGHVPERFEGRIGVFAGCGMASYFMFNLLSNPELVREVGLFLLRHTGNDKDFLATRVSYCFNLQGPSVGVQTACSTSLVAIHQACQSLLSGECDMALAGGVTLELPHGRGYLYHPGEILSPDGHCRAFDHRAQGTVFGSGAGVVVLRRLADAVEQGDHIYAVIRGSAVNNDGAGKIGYFAPSVDGQAGAMLEALSVADVDPHSIGYIECHGTGTAVGDPIEVAALAQAYSGDSDAAPPCAIGSIKTNIGHLDTAAGVASLIKVSLALHHETIPATLNFEAPHPQLGLDDKRFVVNDRLTPWPRGVRPRRAGINSLGVGGTNAHAILEEAPLPRPTDEAKSPWQLLTLSARNRSALDEASTRLADQLADDSTTPLADVAYTLAVGRRAFNQRRVVVAASGAEGAQYLRNRDAQRVFTHTATPGADVVFMFPGGGAQYPNMGRGLYDAEPIFREWVDRGLRVLKGHVDFDLHALWFPRPEEERDAAREMERPSRQLPALFLCEYALAQLWLSRGLEPAALIGHSMGENTAACLAGVMSFEDALGLVTLRGALFERLAGGGMLSIPLSPATLRPLLGEALDIATVNAPELCAVSGPVEALEALRAELAERGVEAKRIPIHVAAHSRALEPILAEFGAYLRRIRLRPPERVVISNRTGLPLTTEQATDPHYWVAHLRETVRFADGLATLLAHPGRVFLEVGPGKTLTSLVKQQPAATPQTTALASLRHPKEQIADEAYLLITFGRLWAAGVNVDRSTLWSQERRRRVALPTYPFQHESYWIAAGQSSGAASETATPLLKTTDPGHWYYRPAWKQRGADVPLEPSSEPQTWLVFVDSAGLAPRLIERLRGAGHDVITVTPGDDYRRLDDHRFTLAPEHGRTGYDALLRDLAALGKVPQRVAHCWLATSETSYRPGSSFFHRVQEQGFYSLMFLAQAWSDEGLPPFHLSVITSGLLQVNAEPVPQPEKATILGPVLVLPRELPGVTAALLDIEFPASGSRWLATSRDSSLEGLANAVFNDLRQRPTNVVAALRGGLRYEQAIEPVRPPEATKGSTPGLRPGGTYLITGGFGGIGQAAAEMLARTCQARLVLIGRSELPPREQWSTLLDDPRRDEARARRIEQVRQLESHGAQVLPLAADVTDVESMRLALEQIHEQFGPLNGVLHAAGVLRDALLPLKTQSDVEEVFTPKVHGTLVLDELLRDEPLDWFVLCSSTSAILGPAGQIDYVAANAFLNAYAASRENHPQRQTVALQWGVWNEVGMAAAAVGLEPADASVLKPEPDMAIEHPLFDSQRGGIHAQQIEMQGTLSPLTHWMLDEHRTSAGEAIVPGTGYLALAQMGLARLSIPTPFEIHDLFFLRPLRVADEASERFAVRLERDPQGYAFMVDTLLSGEPSPRRVRHAQATLRLAEVPPPGTIDVAAIDDRCQLHRATARDAALRSDQEAHLRFGPRWQVLRHVAYGRGEAFARLQLAEKFVGDLTDFALHPGLLDLATGFAMQLIPNYDPNESLWAPVSYGRVRVHAPLPHRLVSWVRWSGGNDPQAEFATFDVTLADEGGRILLEVEQFTIKRLPTGFTLAVADDPAPLDEVGEVLKPDARVSTLTPAELALRHFVSQGIQPSEGVAALERVIRSGVAPQIVVSSLPLDALAKETARVVATMPEQGAKFARPNLDDDYVAPRDDVERSLVAVWEELLGVDRVGVRDNFFDLGGHSLIAVRLFARIKKLFHLDFAISVLFEAPTVEASAALIRESLGRPGAPHAASEEHPTRHLHLVAMHEGDGGRKTPLFLVAGMFGNVLNLRHLAHLIGNDRPCYGLQARGLYGDLEPHDSFEAMATDYLQEIRTIQPRGPYLLGGFSGGGITAYEMARQLRAAGEEVALLALLDTPLSSDAPLTLRDKLTIHWQKLQRQPARYLQQVLGSRLAWEWQRWRKRGRPEPGVAPPGAFHSAAIEAAFRRACDRYVLQPQPLTITLFRPRLRPTHVLGPGRMINADRRFIYEDNGWSRFAERVVVHEVPGDHDSMVLEPNVRTLGTRLRQALNQADVSATVAERSLAAWQGTSSVSPGINTPSDSSAGPRDLPQEANR